MNPAETTRTGYGKAVERKAMTVNRCWLRFGIAAALYVCFGLVSGSIAPLVTLIRRDLEMSAAQMGAVLGAWQIVYVGTSYLAGLSVDRFGIRISLTAGMSLVAASAALRGLAADFTTMLLAVAIFGVGGPTISIGVPKLVAVLMADRDRPTALGIASASPMIGSLLAFGASNSVLLPLLDSWRSIMFLYGGVALMLTLAWWWITPRDTIATAARPLDAVADGVKLGLLELLRLRNVAVALGSAALLFAVTHGTNNWMVAALQMHSYTSAEAGYWAAAASGLSAIGALSIPRFVPVGRRRVALVTILASLGLSVLGLALLDGFALTLSILVFGLVRMAPMPLFFLLLMGTPGLGSRHLGTVGGALFAIAEIGGFGGPFAVGALLDRFGSFALAFGLLSALALALTGIALLLEEHTPGERRVIQPNTNG